MSHIIIKALKKTASLLVMLLLLLWGGIVAYADEINPEHASIIAGLADGGSGVLEVENHNYTILKSSEDIILTAYSGPGGDISIPAGITEVGARGVSATIGSAVAVFKNNTTITSVVIPDSVHTINNQAFRNCSNLSKITLPDEILFIGGYAFAATKITSINIPFPSSPDVTWGNYIFSGCTELASVIFPEDTTIKTLPTRFFLIA